MFSLNKKKETPIKKEIIVKKEIPAELTFSLTTSKKGTKSILCNYFDGEKNFQEYFNFSKKKKLTQGSFLDYKRLCDVFNIEKSLRFEILEMTQFDEVKIMAKKVPVITDAAGFMKWFDVEGGRK